MIPHVGAPRTYPTREIEQLESLNHYHGWIDGCLSGEQPTDGFAYGANDADGTVHSFWRHNLRAAAKGIEF